MCTSRSSRPWDCPRPPAPEALPATGHARDEPPEDHVLAVEMGLRGEEDEELRPIRVLTRVGYRKDPTAIVAQRERLVGNLPPSAPSP